MIDANKLLPKTDYSPLKVHEEFLNKQCYVYTEIGKTNLSKQVTCTITCYFAQSAPELYVFRL